MGGSTKNVSENFDRTSPQFRIPTLSDASFNVDIRDTFMTLPNIYDAFLHDLSLLAVNYSCKKRPSSQLLNLWMSYKLFGKIFG